MLPTAHNSPTLKVDGVNEANESNEPAFVDWVASAGLDAVSPVTSTTVVTSAMTISSPKRIALIALPLWTFASFESLSLQSDFHVSLNWKSFISIIEMNYSTNFAPIKKKRKCYCFTNFSSINFDDDQILKIVNLFRYFYDDFFSKQSNSSSLLRINKSQQRRIHNNYWNKKIWNIVQLLSFYSVHIGVFIKARWSLTKSV